MNVKLELGISYLQKENNYALARYEMGIELNGIFKQNEKVLVWWMKSIIASTCPFAKNIAYFGRWSFD